MAKKSGALTVTLTPSQTAVAIKQMTTVNLANAKKGKDRRGLFIWGPPGVGKSSLVKQVAKEYNLKVIDIRLSQIEPTDLRGIPVPQKENGRTVVDWAVPKQFPWPKEGSLEAEFEEMALIDGKLQKHKYDGAVILLDELPNAPQTVQAASYQLVLDGKLGEYVVPSNVVVMAAGNRETDKGGTFKLNSPLANRFTHVEMVANHDDWEAYAVTAGVHPHVVSFVGSAKENLYTFDPKSGEKAFATPRSWEAVSDILNNCHNLSDSIRIALIAGCVGSGPAIRFDQHCRSTVNLPKASDVLDGKVKKFKFESISQQYALAISLAYELNDRKRQAETVTQKKPEVDLETAINNFLDFCLDNMTREISVMVAKIAIQKYNIKPSPTSVAWKRFTKEVMEYIK